MSFSTIDSQTNLASTIKEVASDASQFSACDKIAKFYDAVKTPARVSYGPLGGKSFTWYVQDSGQSFQVFCACNLVTAGLGQLMITSRMASERPSKRYFTSTSEVDPKTAKVVLKGALLQRHEITLPTPMNK